MRQPKRKPSPWALAILVAGVLMAAPAWAQEDSDGDGVPDWKEDLYKGTGLYLTAMANYAIPLSKSDLEDDAVRRLDNLYGPPSSADVDNAWGMNGRLGWRFHERVAVETQFDWLSTIEIDGQRASGVEEKTEIGLITLTGNAKGYLLTGRFQPYVVAGAGWSRARIDPEGGSKQRDDGFAWRAGAGFDLYFGSRDIAFTVESSYVGPTGDVEDLDYVAVSAGLMLRFYGKNK